MTCNLQIILRSHRLRRQIPLRRSRRYLLRLQNHLRQSLLWPFLSTNTLSNVLLENYLNLFIRLFLRIYNGTYFNLIELISKCVGSWRNGSASALHAEGCGFESRGVHIYLSKKKVAIYFMRNIYLP